MGLCKDGYWRETERFEGKQYIGCGKDQKAALKSLAAKIADAKAGNTVVNGNTSVKKWAETWLETYIRHSGITEKTYANIKCKVNRNIVDKIGSMPIKDVKEIHLQKILNEQEGMSLSHVSKLRAYMRDMFHRAAKLRLIAIDPAADLELPKAADKKRRSLTDAEREAVLATAETNPAGLWVKTLLYCGLRPGETIALQWRDIDLTKGVIKVSKALESGSKDKIKKPKSEAGIRTVPIPESIIADFRNKKGASDEYVFTQVLPANKGKHHTESSLRCYWQSFLREMDIGLGAKVYRNQIVESKIAEDLTPYVLRHTYGTDLQAAGVPINIAKYLMGHADITTTANIYTHENDETVEMAAGLINKYMIKKAIKTQK